MALRFGIEPTEGGRFFREVLAEVARAEELGFDSVWFAEHHGVRDHYWPAPLQVLTALATRTSRITLGTNVVVFPFYHPVRLAEEAAVVDGLSGGRLVLGLAIGYKPDEFALYGAPLAQRGARLEEGVALLKALWTRDGVTFRGRHFTVDDARIEPKPVQRPHPPIWLGGWASGRSEQLDHVQHRVDLRRAPEVAVADERDQVAEDALGLVPIELVQQPAADDDVGLAAVEPHGRLVGDGRVQQPHARRRDPGRDRHLADDVPELSLLEVARRGLAGTHGEERLAHPGREPDRADGEPAPRRERGRHGRDDGGRVREPHGDDHVEPAHHHAGRLEQGIAEHGHPGHRPREDAEPQEQDRGHVDEGEAHETEVDEQADRGQEAAPAHPRAHTAASRHVARRFRAWKSKKLACRTSGSCAAMVAARSLCRWRAAGVEAGRHRTGASGLAPLDKLVSICSHTWAMPGPRRLPSRQRRHAIVDAVTGAFAEKGFDGTTTRELARVAGVSEALLYRHFPSKESLYAAMLEACARGPVLAEFHRVLGQEASTATLVRLVHFLVSRFVLSDDAHKIAMDRLALRSLLEDGDFVRVVARHFAASWIRKVEACMKAAARAGDMTAPPVRCDLRAWFVHHLAFALMVHLHPKVPALNYKAPKRALVDGAVWFALLGMGLKERAVRRHYPRTTPSPAAGPGAR